MAAPTFFAEFEYLQLQQKPYYTVTWGYDAATSILIVDLKVDAAYPDPWAKPVRLRFWTPDTTGTLTWAAAPESVELSRRVTVGIPRPRPTRIPRRIFQVWLQAEIAENKITIPAAMTNPIQSWRKLNPEYEYALYNDQMIRDFFAREYPPTYLEAYDLLLPKAFKADFWRYAVLYKFGGVYADSKMTLLVPLRQLIRPQDSVVLTVDGEGSIAIAFMAFEPGHPLLKRILDKILDMVGRRDKSTHPLALTGPIVAAEAMREHFGFAGMPPLGQGPDWTTYTFGQPGTLTSEKQYFYDAEGRPIIKYMYDGYKETVNQEWKHYPALWWAGIVFRDRVPPHVAALPDMDSPPEWLIVNRK